MTVSPAQTTPPETGKNWGFWAAGGDQESAGFKAWKVLQSGGWGSKALELFGQLDDRRTQNLCLQWGRRLKKGPVTDRIFCKLLKSTGTVFKRADSSVRPLWCFFCHSIKRELESHTWWGWKSWGCRAQAVPLYWLTPNDSKVGWYLCSGRSVSPCSHSRIQVGI